MSDPLEKSSLEHVVYREFRHTVDQIFCVLSVSTRHARHGIE